MGRKKLPIQFKKCVTCENDFNPGKHKEKLNCSPECLKLYNTKHKDERMEKTFAAIKNKYGVDSFPETNGFSDKVKATKKKLYNDENYNNADQIKKTLLENYNVESVGQIESNSEKTKKTKLERYNDENYNNRKKAEETNLLTYGVKHHLQSPEILEKQFQTNLKLYKTKHVINTNYAKEQLKKKNIEKFGSEFYFNSQQYFETQLENKIERIQNILFENQLEFDYNQYSKLRTKDDIGSLHYVQYKITCKICDNIFDSSLNKIPICRDCYPLTSISKQQQEVREFLSQNKIIFIENTRKIITPFELDFYIPSLHIAIELNGNYYHSELAGNKDKNYHINKTKLCNQKGIQLIHIFEDEWMFKKDIVKSRLKNILNIIDNKIFARKCKIAFPDHKEKQLFLEENHIQGKDISFFSVGLYHNNELMSIMTFSKPRLSLGLSNKKDKTNHVELSRFCSKKNYNIPGAFQRLMKSFINQHPNIESIYTYADCRWSGILYESTVYHQYGFVFSGYSKPSYFYIFKNNYFHRFHRFTFNKQKLAKLIDTSTTKTEWEMAKENKMDRIWDCGTMKFVLIL